MHACFFVFAGFLSIDPFLCVPRLLGIMHRHIFRGLEYVLDRDMVVDTTLVGTVLNGLSQASALVQSLKFFRYC